MCGNVLHRRRKQVVPSHSLHCSVGVSDLDAKVTVSSAWMSVAPSLLPDTLTWIVTGFFMWKYLSVVSSHTNDLSLSNATSYVAFQLYSTLVFRSPLSVTVWEDSCGMNGERYVTIPRKL